MKNYFSFPVTDCLHLTHEMVYHKHDYYHYDIMAEEAVKIIVGMMK